MTPTRLRPSRRTRTRLSSWSTSDAAAGRTRPAMRSHRCFRARRAVLRGQEAQRYLSTRSDAAERTQVRPKTACELPKNPFW